MAVGMITAPTNVYGASQQILADQVEIDIEDKVRLLERNKTPLMYLLQHPRFKGRDAHNPKFMWLEDELRPRYTNVTASYTNVATSIVVTAGTGIYFIIGDMIRNELTGENMQVDVTHTGTDTVPVLRSIGAVAGTASVGTTDGIIRLANASAQGANMPNIAMTRKVANYNYTQIMRTAFGVNNTLKATDLYGGAELNYQQMKVGIEHNRSEQQTAWFGQREITTTVTAGVGPTTYTGGIFEYIVTNRTNLAAAALTEDNFETFLQTVFRYSNDTKVLFATPKLTARLSKFAQGKVQPVNSSVETWGVAMKMYQSTQGEDLRIVTMKDWADYSSATGANPGLGTYGIVLDMDCIMRRPLQTRDTKLLVERQGTSQDATLKEYLGEIGYMIMEEKKHGIIYNWT